MKLSELTLDHKSPLEDMRSLLDTTGVLRVKGLFARYEVLEARNAVASAFNPANDEKHDERDSEAVRTGIQKLKIGGINARTQPTRFMRMLYGHMPLFDRLTTFRNRLYGMPDDFAKGTNGAYWTASRLQQYPSGGGFMSAHRDVETAWVAKQAGLTRYVNPLLLMSQKGVDYEVGGGFIGPEKNRWEYEGECEIGDVMVYGADVLHGVADIDPHKPLDLGFGGRVVAIATLMKRFTRAEAQAYYEMDFESV